MRMPQAKTPDYIEEQAAKHTVNGSVLPHEPGWKGRQTPVRKNLAQIPLDAKQMVKAVTVVDKNGKKRRRHLTEKQIKYSSYRAQGYSKRQAALKAGYSEMAARIPQRIDQSATTQAFFYNMRDRLIGTGLTEEYFAMKFKEWMEAKKTVKGGGKVPDSRGDKADQAVPE